jgi:4-amino-4-deoxy-L-arabinose transferase-like glycosyltransferase
LSWSTGIFTDEGWKNYAPRNRVLFGFWKGYPWESNGWIYESPLMTALTWFSFEQGGVSLETARVPNKILSLLLALTLFLTAKDLLGLQGGTLALACYVFDFNAVLFARLSLFETAVSCFLMLTLFFWNKTSRSPWFGIPTSISFLLAFLSKPTALIVLPMLLIEWALPWIKTRGGDRSPEERRAKTAALAAGVTLLALGAAWYLLWKLPHRQEIWTQEKKMEGMLQGSAGELLKNHLTLFEEGFFHKNPFLLLTAAYGFLALGLGPLRMWLQPHNPWRWIAGWPLCFLCVFSLDRYHPPRYFIPLLGPAILLAVRFLLVETPTFVQTIRRRTATRRGILLGGLLMATAHYHLAFFLLHYLPRFPGTIAAAAGLGILGTLLLWMLCGRKNDRPAAWSIPISMTLLALPGLLLWSSWFPNRTHLMLESARGIRQLLPADAVVAGESAVALSLSLPHRIIDIDSPNKPIGNAPKIMQIQPTHFIVEPRQFDEFPEELRRRSELLGTFPLPYGQAAVFRYRSDPPDSS